MPMTRIALVTSEFLPIAGGIGTYTRELARAAVARGHELTLLAPTFGQDNLEHDRFEPFQVLRYPGRGASLRDYRALLPAVLGLARRADLDVLHACDSPSLAALSVTQPLHRRAFIATVHGSDVSRAAGGVYGVVSRACGFYTRPQRILANSQYTRGLLLQNCPGVDPERAIVAPLGVDDFWFQPPDEAGWLRERGVDETERLVVCVARLTARKGQLQAVRAFAGLPEHVRAGTRLLLVGAANGSDADCAYAAELERLVAASRAPVLLTGKLSMTQVRSLYGKAELFLLPGGADGPWVEGFGLVFLEAAAQGLPAVAGRQGGVPEAVVDERTGLLVKPGDVAALTEALERLLVDHTLRKQLGQQARARARSLTWDRCAAVTYD